MALPPGVKSPTATSLLNSDWAQDTGGTVEKVSGGITRPGAIHRHQGASPTDSTLRIRPGRLGTSCAS